jgi:hypothetical protein
VSTRTEDDPPALVLAVALAVADASPLLAVAVALAVDSCELHPRVASTANTMIARRAMSVLLRWGG